MQSYGQEKQLHSLMEQLKWRYPVLFGCKKMDRKLIIFGNGLGMALDPKHFSLQRALQDVWDEKDFLFAKQKELIEHCYDPPLSH